MHFDLPIETLQNYAPNVACPEDFDAFWKRTLDETREHPLEAAFEQLELGLRTLETFDVTFSGFGGTRVKGWLLLPKERSAPLPCVVEYVGYGGGRGSPLDWLLWSSAGYAHFVMDTRGQGSSWLRGDTPDPHGSGPHYPGFMTGGILTPEAYYYRRVFADAARAVEAARTHPAVDASRVLVTGGSQGGALALAVAGLVPELWAAMPDVPFLCHFRRATTLVDTLPYGEIRNYLKVHRDKTEAVYRTLSYFDGVNFAERARARALFSVALMDDICPPSTVFAAYNRYRGEKDIRVYEFNNHEGGQSVQKLEQLRFLRGLGVGK